MKQHYKNLLFICRANLQRSPTAEEIFKDKYVTKSAGIDIDSKNPIDKEILKWADIVFVMEDWMRKEIENRFPDQHIKKRIVSLDIPYMYYRMEPELIRELKQKVNKYL